MSHLDIEHAVWRPVEAEVQNLSLTQASPHTIAVCPGELWTVQHGGGVIVHLTSHENVAQLQSSGLLNEGRRRLS